MIITLGFATTGLTTDPQPDMPKVQLKTNHGIILVELDPKAAPKTVENFINYVQEGFYNGTIFHRVIKGFMIQGGGFGQELEKKSTKKPIINEADNGLQNKQGTIAMARTSDPHSASSQFFINTVDNSFLNFKAKNSRGWGYCVFGKVIDGMDIVAAIEKQPTTTTTGYRDVPVNPVIIEEALIIKPSGSSPVKQAPEKNN